MNPATLTIRVISTVILIYGACSVCGENPLPVSEGEADKAEKLKTQLLQQFTESVYPLLQRGGEKSCVGCHKSEKNSSLVLVGNAKDDFNLLLQNNYFDPQQPDSLLARVSHKKASVRMPEDEKPWSPRDIQVLRAYVASLKGYEQMDPLADERFPEALLSPYEGEVPPAKDNQFLTYRQLRGKVKTIFADDWVRKGRDLFQENLALFGGADFSQRFNESSEPTSSFLTGLNMMAHDVSSRAYSQASGPFFGRAEEIAAPDKLEVVDDAYRKEITRLYNTILFRSPSEEEISQSFKLLNSVYSAKLEIESGDYELAFELAVEDSATGLKETSTVLIPVSGEYRGVYQELLDQTGGMQSTEAGGFLVRKSLGRTITLEPGQSGQRLVIHNDQTEGNVSFAGIELACQGEQSQRIRADHASIQPDGAWTIKGDRGFTSYEDGNNEKGRSRITIPLNVDKAGPYEITMLWRKDPRNAPQVLVEVFLTDKESKVALPPLLPVPPPGEAPFTYDSSDDTKPFAELGPDFQFAEDSFVEISNNKTLDLVTAGAVGFIPSDKAAKEFIIDSKDAEGADKWSRFDSGQFKAYNATGTQIHDSEEKDTKKKKENLFLKFRPAKTKPENGWKPETSYKVRIYYPGKNGHESNVPVVVHARQSSPIIRVSHPARAKADSIIELDASASYTIQRSGLKFTWKQLDGPPVKMDNNGPVLKFIAPRRSLQQAAWVALAEALVRHPDFLFTRPPSQWKVTDPTERKRLQLVKIALDLVGRSPNEAELARLEAGTSIREFLNSFLASEEFRDFYFHRIRLYLESQGTETQDEPVRLWSYVAFNDLPFQQILAADFTVDKDMKKQPRPAYHGRSGLLTTKGFIEGKPGLPHFNYAAQVSMMFLGYIFEVPAEIVAQRDGFTPAGTTDPKSACYSCHKLLTPLAFQRSYWTDDGNYQTKRKDGIPIDASDQQLVDEYPFPGVGMEAFATQAVRKERFIRTIINTHFNFYFGRAMRFHTDERALYKKLWDQVHASDFKIRELIRAIMMQPEYMAES